jgi:Ca-activated chloride channel family protein
MITSIPRLTDEELPLKGSDEEPGFGCLRTSRGHLPLKAMEVRGRIDGLLSQVSLCQTFVNALDEPLEATYIFPLPDRTAVRGFRMELKGRRVEGVLEEREKARLDYDRALAAGQRAAIAEEERPNVFTLRVGNLMPGEEATVHLELAGVLPNSDGEVTFRFPLVVAPRYIPGVPLGEPSAGDGTAADTDAVPDASRISPPIMLQGFRNPVRLSLTVDLYDYNGAVSTDLVRSSLHAILTEEKGGFRRVRLAASDRLDRDFILRFRLGSQEASGPVLSTLTFHPDQGGDGRAGTFALTLIPPSEIQTQSRSRHVVFVLDRSGSMAGWKIVAARRAMARMIDTLTSADRFGIVAFDTGVESPPGLQIEPVTASDRNRYRALEYLAKIEARGGTEMAEPLRQAVAMLGGGKRDRNCDAILVLVTDGQVGNEDQILQMLAPKLSGIRVFTLGIDRAVNDTFLRRLAELGRGACELVESEDRLDEVMAAIHRQIGTALLTGLALEPEGFAIEPDSLVPERLPDLFSGAPLLVLGRYRGHAVGRLRVQAQDTSGSVWFHIVEGRVRENPAIAAVWARGQVRKLEDRYVIGKGKLTVLERELVAVSIRHQVLCRFTAYVAIDRSLAPKKTGKMHRIMQPVEMPAGWDEHEVLMASDRSSRRLIRSADFTFCAPDPSDAGSLAARRPSVSPPRKKEMKRGYAESSFGDQSAGSFPHEPMFEEPFSPLVESPGPPTVEGVPDRYQLTRQSGWGASGRAYEAFDRESGRTVIVQVLRFLPDQVDVRTRIAEKLVGLSHPSLVRVLHVGRHKETVVFVTEAVSQAKTLDQVLRAVSPDPPESARWISQIADAVHYLDANGVVYRDLRPSAVVIGHDGLARLTDLASCCVMKEGPPPIRSFGAPAYLAPEQVQFEGILNVRGTIYSLGVVFYELLTGVPAFSSLNWRERFTEILKTVPPAPRSIRRSIPKELETICLTAMARKPENRYATADELARELRQFLSAQPERRRSFWKRK